MKILVTGYQGFIGQNMLEALDKEHEVTAFEWNNQSLPSFEGLDWCIHLGAISSTTETNVDKVMEQNYDFSRWVVNECQTHNVNLQYASSASVYGLISSFTEESPANPQSPYAWSKYLFDRYVLKMIEAGKITVRVQGFRYFNVYGPHEDHKDQPSPHHRFNKQAKETGVIELFEGSNEFCRDFVPVETVIDVHKKFFDVNESGIWNLGTGRTTSFEDIAKKIAKKYDAVIKYIPMPDNIAKQYQKYTCADVTKLKKHHNI